MQLWQKTINNFAIENLWQKTQADVKNLFQQGSLCSQRFMPYQYLSALQDEAILTEVYSGKFDQLIEKMFWHRISGGHPELQDLFSSFGLSSNAGKFILWGHEIMEILGCGSSSVVYRTAEQHAMKVVFSPHKKKLLYEYSLLSAIKCDNIVKVLEFYESSQGAGMLLEKLSFPSSDETGYINGLSHLHQLGLCHGDIRYKNLGSDKNGTAKLFDLGNSFYGTSDEMQKEDVDLRLLLEKFNRSEQKYDTPCWK